MNLNLDGLIVLTPERIAKKMRSKCSILLISAIFLSSLMVGNASADTLILKDGKRIACDGAWKENGIIKCSIKGSVIGYPEEDVNRVVLDQVKNKDNQPKNLKQYYPKTSYHQKNVSNVISRSPANITPRKTESSHAKSLRKDSFDKSARYFAIPFTIITMIILLRRFRDTIPAEYRYRKKNALFTPAERSFLGVLDQAVGESFYILGKVRVADVITPEKGIPAKVWGRAFNKISQKHFDYLLCDKDDLSVVCAIELDDKSHLSETRRRRDIFLEKACDSAGIPLIRVPVRNAYDINEAREFILSQLN